MEDSVLEMLQKLREAAESRIATKAIEKELHEKCGVTENEKLREELRLQYPHQIDGASLLHDHFLSAIQEALGKLLMLAAACRPEIRGWLYGAVLSNLTMIVEQIKTKRDTVEAVEKAALEIVKSETN